jgi:oligo-1,6-glucosidase
MTNAPFNTIEDFRDIESLRHYAEAVDGGASPDDVLRALRTMGRDNARTPMQWDAGRHAGFTTGEPWIPVNPNHDSINAEAAVADPDSVFHHYRRLIELRHAMPVIARGDFTMRLEQDERVYAFTRSLEGEELLVLGNFSGDPVVVQVEGWTGAEEPLIGGPGLALGPWEGKAFRRSGGR